ncbi:TldD/PmbA family protein [Candidatus Woesearchaeota archaeon]|nr:TldD/PmbA family protein [Candidatus Woesearchaeota archaeon]
MQLDHDLAELAIDAALKGGAKFADARLEGSVSGGILLKNGVAELSGSEERSGLGIRVLVGRTLGFAATTSLSGESVRKSAELAVADAKKAGRLRNRTRLSAHRPHKAKYEVRQRIRLDELSPKEKLGELMQIEKSILATRIRVPYRYFSYNDCIEEKFYVNSEGARISSVIPRVNFHYFTTLVQGRHAAQRYWQYGKASGFEGFREFRLDERLAEEVIAMKRNVEKGIQPPKGKLDVVVGPQITGIIVHESCGHPYEADRILGREAAQAGESFLDRGSIGLQIGSQAVSIIDDPTIPNSFGFYLYDDEGVKACSRQLMKAGKVNEFLHSRESAAEMHQPVNAAARSSGFDREPIPRMANTIVEEGDYSEDELIAGIKKGVYIKSFTEWNIDDRRVHQKYVGAEAYMIQGGRLGQPVKSPTIEISTYALYKAIDATANNTEYHAGSCGKGEPMQALPVWFGGPSMRIRGIQLK